MRQYIFRKPPFSFIAPSKGTIAQHQQKAPVQKGLSRNTNKKPPLCKGGCRGIPTKSPPLCKGGCRGISTKSPPCAKGGADVIGGGIVKLPICRLFKMTVRQSLSHGFAATAPFAGGSLIKLCCTMLSFGRPIKCALSLFHIFICKLFPVSIARQSPFMIQ